MSASAAAASKYGKGFMGQFKKQWDARPELVGSSILTILSLGLGIAGLNYYYTHDLDNRKYKQHYTVYRHDDPRVAKIRQD